MKSASHQDHVCSVLPGTISRLSSAGGWARMKSILARIGLIIALSRYRK